MTYVLVKWADNIGDKMEFDGHGLLTEDAWERMYAHLISRDTPYTFKLGEHTTIEYRNGRDFLSRIETSPVSAHQFKTLVELELTIGGFLFVLGYAAEVRQKEDYCLLTGETNKWR